MKNTTPPKNTKKDFDKVFESPLDWCPLFGYLPDIEEYDVCYDKTVLDLVESCLDIINDCRNNFGFDYRPNLHMTKYACLPDLNYLLPNADDDVIVYIKSLRCLFRNLDFLSLKTASLYDFNEALVNAILCSYKTIRIAITFPEKPIGRASNLHDNALSVIAEDIRLDRVFWRDSVLLDEARKLTNSAATLDNIRLFSLYTILEAWLIVTRLLLKTKHEKENLLFCMERLSYARELLNIAEHHKDQQHLSGIHQANMTLAEDKKVLEDKLDEVIPLLTALEKKATPYLKRQSEAGRASAEARAKRALPKKERWAKTAEVICDEFYKSPRKRKNITILNIANEIIKRGSLEKKQLSAIRQDEDVRAVVNRWKAKTKGQ